jgi:hypothetical protein
MGLGAVAAYLVGMHMAAAGLLAPFFATLFPPALLAPYTSLLLVSIMFGYLLSPLHLCLALTNQYFGTSYGQTVGKLAVPLLAIVLTALVQLLFLA